MQQDTFFYHNFPQSPQLQYPNTNSYPGQPSTIPWSPNYIPEVNLSPQNIPIPYNYGSQLQSNITPVSTAAYDSPPTFSWAHTVPSLMPWVTKGDLNVPDPVMRFTAPFPPDPCTSQTATSWELLNNLGANKTNANMHLKRKSDLDVIEVAAPNKMCITEDRMAARLKELHISNQYTVPLESSAFGSHSSSSTDVTEKSITNLQQLEAVLKESTTGGSISSKSLILAPELKKLVEPEKIFASTFLNKVERPSMAVVVWQPQNKILRNVNDNPKSDSDIEESEDSSISVTKIDNNNFISQQISAMCSENSSFTISRSCEDASNSFVNCDDVMDT